MHNSVKVIFFIIGFSSPWELIAQLPELKQQQGMASFYAAKFEGRRTANGEIFSNSDFTAAHQTLPFNTLVRVTNPDNNKTIVVRINDRGPHIKGRVIDLTIAGAKKIGLDIKGAIPVVILVPETTLLTNEIYNAFNAHRYSDCLGNMDELRHTTIFLWKTENLQHMLYIANDLDDIQEKGKIIIERSGKWYFLLITGFKNRKEADETITKSEKQGFLKSGFYDIK